MPAETLIEKGAGYYRGKEVVHSGSLLVGAIGGAAVVLLAQSWLNIASARAKLEAAQRNAVFAKMRANIKPIATAKFVEEPKSILFI